MADFEDNISNSNNILYSGDYEYVELGNSDIRDFFSNHLADDIKVLTKNSSIEFWGKYFSKKNKTVMQLDKDDWVLKVKWENIGYWTKDYDCNCISNVKNLLMKCINWDGNASIYFCSSCYNILKTSWSIFLDNWIEFITYNEDGAIIIAENKSEAVSFAAIGLIQITNRYI